MTGRKLIVTVGIIGLLIAACGVSEARPRISSAKARSCLHRALAAEHHGQRNTSSLFLQAFAEAIALTQPSLPTPLREEGFLIAARCRHADLVPQVQLAIATYLKVFPKGKRRAEVLIEAIRLDLALGAPAAAMVAIEEANELANDEQTGTLSDLLYRALHELHRYRSGEKMVTDVLSLSDRRLATWATREQQRYVKANEKVAQALRDAETMVHPAERAAMLAAFANVFAHASLAPHAALVGALERDRIAPLYHARAVRFMGRERWVMHRQTLQQRTATHRDFLARFPQADAELLGFAMRELHAIALHEQHDVAVAAGWLDQLERVPGWGERAIVARIMMKLHDASIAAPETFQLLTELNRHREVLPYDDGWWPLMTRQRLAQLMVFAALLQDEPTTARTFVTEAAFTTAWHRLPLAWLVELAIKDRADDLRVTVEARKADLEAKNLALIERFLMPLHRPVPPLERQVLAALLIMNEFPDTGIDLLHGALKQGRDHRFSDHLLGALAQAYQDHMQPVEAQAVWNQLRRLYPHSVWLR